MIIISAIGSFKGTISSREINGLVKKTGEKNNIVVETVTVADGGDGLLVALTDSMGGEYREIATADALGREIKAQVSVCGDTGIVEMALASGLALLDETELNPLKASTYGTGILIRGLSEQGIEKIILGIGGSATNDGGMGCLNALGFEFFGKNGEVLKPCGENLQYVREISNENVPEAVKRLKIEIACDVTNPLLGEQGAAYVYARQKGADGEMLKILEKGMENYADAVARFVGMDFRSIPGTGAAGGLGYGLLSLLGAQLKKGAQIVLEKANYEKKLENADLVITGEGQIDNQTAYGKLPGIVAEKAKNKGVRCIALCGGNKASKEVLKGMGIEEVYCLTDYAELRECMENTEKTAEKAIKDIIKKEITGK